MNSHSHVLTITRNLYNVRRGEYELNIQRLFVRHFPQDFVDHPVYDSLIIQKHYLFHSRTINRALFANSSDQVLRSSFVEVHGTEDIVVPRIPFVSVEARVNAESC